MTGAANKTHPAGGILVTSINIMQQITVFVNLRGKLNGRHQLNSTVGRNRIFFRFRLSCSQAPLKLGEKERENGRATLKLEKKGSRDLTQKRENKAETEYISVGKNVFEISL